MMGKIINMGGYGVYVWTSYGITLGLLGLQVLHAYLNKKNKYD